MKRRKYNSNDKCKVFCSIKGIFQLKFKEKYMNKCFCDFVSHVQFYSNAAFMRKVFYLPSLFIITHHKDNIIFIIYINDKSPIKFFISSKTFFQIHKMYFNRAYNSFESIALFKTNMSNKCRIIW